MTVTPIPAGTANWDVPLNAALADLQSQVTTNGSNITSVTTTANNAVPKGTLVINAADYGADSTGATDSTAAIQSAISALGANGGKVYLPPGSYLLNGATGLSLATAGTVLTGAGAETTKLLIGAAFTGAAAVSVTAYNCQVQDLSVSGQSSTTTSNPAADAIQITGVRRAKVNRVTFFNVNGWCIKAAATSANGTSNPLATMISQVFGSSCAGGIYFLGNTTQGYAVNSSVSDAQFNLGGVTTGLSANLDGIRVEDAWDVLLSNVLTWMSVGTGSALHVVGNCAATFIKNLDALGPTTGANVLIEDGANGSVQNVQINGGVIQQGLTGLTISGGSNQIRVNTVRFINNQTHGVVVSGTGSAIYLNQLFFSASGQAAAGTNYDINWSGTATGYITFCRFASPIVSTGVAGVQQTINVAAGQNVRVAAADFQGTSSTSSNWFTNTPAGVMEMSAGSFDFVTGAVFKGNIAAQPSASGNTVLSGNVNGNQSFDNFRVTGDGKIAIGPGTGSRDTTWGRQGTAQIGTADSDVIIGLAGKGLRVKEGTAAKMGTATLVAGSAVVGNTSVTATSRIFVTSNADGGAPGWIRVSARTAGTSFTITSSSGTDTSTVAWLLVEPA